MRRLPLAAMIVSALWIATPPAEAKWEKSHKQGLEGKFFHKAHLVLKHQEDLGLSDEQAAAIRALKTATKKTLIRHEADVDTLALDIGEALRADSVDTARVNELIDQKYAAKAQKAKSLAGAYAQLKGQLTAEQRKTLKTLKKDYAKKKHHGRTSVE